MEKRVIFAIIISFFFIYIYNVSVIEPQMQELRKQQEEQEKVKTNKDITADTELANIKTEIDNKIINNKTEPEIKTNTDAAKEITKINTEIHTIKTKLYTLNFTNNGAAVSDIVLNNYTEIESEDKLNLLKFNEMNSLYNRPGFLLTLSNSNELSNTNFKITEKSNNSVTFEYITKTHYYDNQTESIKKSDLPAGLKIEKTYSIVSDSYILTLDIKITKQDNTDINKLNFISETDPETQKEYIGGIKLSLLSGLIVENEKDNELVYYINEDLKNITPRSGKEFTENEIVYYKKIVQTPKLKWLGISSNYFTAITIIPETLNTNIIKSVSKEKNIGYEYISSPLKFDKNNIIEFNFTNYIGPKTYYLLKNTLPGYKLETSINYGWFETLALILLRVLKFFYSIIPNYGISIIILTIVINIILYPLKKKSMGAMEGMKDLQPKMQELKEKYKDDKQKIQQETMRLYKEHGVNPLGGCLPMVLQIPIFIGLFRMLQYSIELRGAEFLYITDLSAADSTMILPILMGVTMFIQQKMTPTPPEQQKTMMFLPIIFTFILRTMPAGLILYWTSFNVISVLQQLYQMKSKTKKIKVKK